MKYSTYVMKFRDYAVYCITHYIKAAGLPLKDKWVNYVLVAIQIATVNIEKDTIYKKVMNLLERMGVYVNEVAQGKVRLFL